ncbi:hypothetical protein FEM48_Zijuj05G0082000 [Ziziphus jujuba var. spinosa]|uniref:Transcription factor MYB35-like n=1 Tax=Ziziphus jujuba var. spinosa TaxID=714518 RepID=A0A978VDU2_ZIZJJ|nr:hypothetical protein FEM48_Zijuj05G0082000 [Ziziphus jujuba var. spinosa]
MVRPPCCDKQNVKRGLWSAEEDAKILEYVSKHGTGNWTAVPKRADLKHESFTPKEEELIVRLHAAIGSRWSIIAQELPGRTDNDVKNYWNTKLRKKLADMGIDPVTHKPYSQILADYGNIGGLPKTGIRIGSLNKDLKNAILMKPEPFALPPPQQRLSNLSTNSIPTMVLPKSEPTHESMFNNNQSNNQSLDLLSQLQAIKMVTEASNCNNHEFSNPQDFWNPKPTLSSPSSSSSTCTSSAMQQEKSAIAFNWNDFLLEDEFLPSNYPQEQETMVEFSSSEILNQTQNTIIPETHIQIEAGLQEYNGEIGMENTLSSSNEVHDLSSSCESSFVDALLAREDEILLEFPDLLEEPVYYGL